MPKLKDCRQPGQDQMKIKTSQDHVRVRAMSGPKASGSHADSPKDFSSSLQGECTYLHRQQWGEGARACWGGLILEELSEQLLGTASEKETSTELDETGGVPSISTHKIQPGD